MAHRATARPPVPLAGATALLVALGCASPAPAPSPQRAPAPRPAPAPRDDAAVYRSGHIEHTRYLEREVARLQADLAEAEEAMVAIESGLRGDHSRADAASALAESRIAVERAGRVATWRRQELSEARGKLQDAERQFQEGHLGSAIFFASRARRIAEDLTAEAHRVAETDGERLFVDTERANLRTAPSMRADVILTLEEDTPVFPRRSDGRWLLVRTPSGPAGWIHQNLLRE